MAFIRCGGGGSGAKVLSGTTTPSANIGSNGDVYFQIGFKGSLLHFDEDFTDENGIAWNANGSPVVSADQSKFGGKSLYLNGSSGLQSGDNDAFDFGTNDFTVSCWIYPTTTGRKSLFANQGTGIAMDIFFNGNSANLWMSSTGNSWDIIQSDRAGTNSGIGTITVNTNEWTHIAFVRNGSVVRSYINGVLNKEVIISSTAKVFSRTKLNIGGGDAIGTYRYVGYIDEFVVVNGKALWTHSFTPPTKPFDIDDFLNNVIDTFCKVNGVWQPLVGTDINDISI